MQLCLLLVRAGVWVERTGRRFVRKSLHPFKAGETGAFRVPFFMQDKLTADVSVARRHLRHCRV